MTRSKKWHWALALAALSACGGGSKNDATVPTAAAEAPTAPAVGDTAPLPTIPDAPAAEPAAVLATISLGDPVGQLAALSSFVDGVQPGVGAMVNLNGVLPMLAGAVGAPGLDGVATDKPLWIVALDAKKSGGSAVLVFAVADETKLKGSVSGNAELIVHKGYAAVGTRTSLQIAAPWALSNLAARPPKQELTLVIQVQRFMAGYGAEIEQGLRAGMGQSQAPAERMASEATLSVMRQVERFEATMLPTPTSISVQATIQPTAGGKLAGFAAAQQPTDYAFAGRLGKGPWPVLAAGRIDLTPMREFFVAIVTQSGGPATQVGQVFDLLGNEHAIGVRPDGEAVTLAALLGLTDGKAAAALFDTVMAAAAKSGPHRWDALSATVKPGALKAGGGALHEVSFSPGADASAEDKKDFAKWGKNGLKLYAGVVGNALVASLDRSGKKAAQSLAGAAGKPARLEVDELTRAALAASAERKESGVVLFDLAVAARRAPGAPAPRPSKTARPPVQVGLGFAGGQIGGHLHLPVEQVKAAVEQAMAR